MQEHGIMVNRIKLTVNISPALLKAVQIEAVTKGLTYSDLCTSRLLQFIGTPGTDELPLRIKKCQQAGGFSTRGRPSTAFLNIHGPILRKKATFYIDQQLCLSIRKSAKRTAVNVSDFVNFALSYSPPDPTRRRTKSAV